MDFDFGPLWSNLATIHKSKSGKKRQLYTRAIWIFSYVATATRLKWKCDYGLKGERENVSFVPKLTHILSSRVHEETQGVTKDFQKP